MKRKKELIYDLLTRRLTRIRYDVRIVLCYSVYDGNIIGEDLTCNTFTKHICTCNNKVLCLNYHYLIVCMHECKYEWLNYISIRYISYDFFTLMWKALLKISAEQITANRTSPVDMWLWATNGWDMMPWVMYEWTVGLVYSYVNPYTCPI